MFSFTLSKRLLCLSVLLSLCSLIGASEAPPLSLSAYLTVDSVIKIAQEASAREEALAVIKRMQLTKAYLEVYRSGVKAEEEDLIACRDFFLEAGLAVCGGIATVPGGDFGVEADVGLHWLNYQHPKTQADLERVVRRAARVFEEFIIDDFLCSGDTSPISDAARRGRPWGVYRRDLLTQLSAELFIGAAREERPDITMIVKFPQWYDRFHLFGYDVERFPQLYDRVFIGTESRGAYTQRYGYVQPYESFNNFRWISEIAGEKTGAAWFDHGDCEGIDFVDQAWQSVLAGAKELILFNYGNLAAGHAGHALLMEDYPKLQELAKAIAEAPVTGVPAYKPMHSDAGGDLYLLDFLGMLGIPLIPTAQFPETAQTLFLPTQAASDPTAADKAVAAIEAGKRVILTSGFLARFPQHTRLHQCAGVRGPVQPRRLSAKAIVADGHHLKLPIPLDLEADLTPNAAVTVLEAIVDKRKIPYLVQRQSGNGGVVAVLNCHTFSQADFDAVGEVLLAPKPIYLLDAPESWLNAIRDAFGYVAGCRLRGPGRVTLQPLGPDRSYFIQNYRKEAVTIIVEFDEHPGGSLLCGNRLAPDKRGQVAVDPPKACYIELPARSRAWLYALFAHIDF